jgi:hypothetical protein
MKDEFASACRAVVALALKNGWASVTISPTARDVRRAQVREAMRRHRSGEREKTGKKARAYHFKAHSQTTKEGVK